MNFSCARALACVSICLSGVFDFFASASACSYSGVATSVWPLSFPILMSICPWGRSIFLCCLSRTMRSHCLYLRPNAEVCVNISFASFCMFCFWHMSESCVAGLFFFMKMGVVQTSSAPASSRICVVCAIICGVMSSRLVTISVICVFEGVSVMLIVIG